MRLINPDGLPIGLRNSPFGFPLYLSQDMQGRLTQLASLPL